MRRIFYDKSSGDVFRVWMGEGDYKKLTPHEEAAACGFDNCACMEWMDPDPAIEAAFAPVDAEGKERLVMVTVDVSGAEPRLVFAYEPMPEPGTNEAADMAAALALLGVAPEEA